MSGEITSRPTPPCTESGSHVATCFSDLFQYDVLNEIVFKIIAEIPYTLQGTPLHQVCKRLRVLSATTREGRSFIARDHAMRINNWLLNICALVKIEAYHPNHHTRELINPRLAHPPFALFYQFIECNSWKVALSTSLVGSIAEHDPEIALKMVSELEPGPLKGQLEIQIATKVFPHSQKQAKKLVDSTDDNLDDVLEDATIQPAEMLTKFYPEWSLRTSSGCDSFYIHLDMLRKVSKVWERRNPDYLLSLAQYGEDLIRFYPWRQIYRMTGAVISVGTGNFEHANTYIGRAIKEAGETNIKNNFFVSESTNYSQEMLDVEKINIIYFLSILDVNEARQLCQIILTNTDHKTLINSILNNEIGIEEAVETAEGLNYKCTEWIAKNKKPGNMIIGIIAVCYKNRSPQRAKDICLSFIERVIKSRFEYECDCVLLLAILYEFADTDLEGTLDIVEKISNPEVKASVLIDLSEYCSKYNQDFANRLLRLAAKEVWKYNLISYKIGYLLAKIQARISLQDALKTILDYYQGFVLAAIPASNFSRVGKIFLS